MIQTYNRILQEIQKFNDFFDGTAQIQKIYSSSYYVCLQTRLPGKTHYLFFGRGHGYEGFLNGPKQIPSFLRKRDQFLEYLRKHLSSAVLNNIDMDEQDRIIRISYRKWGETCSLMLFYSGRDLYFANVYYDKSKELFCTFRSWVNKSVDEKLDDFEIFNEVGRKNIDSKAELSYKAISIDNILKNEKKAALKIAGPQKSKKFLNRKKGRILADIEKVQTWPDLQKVAQDESKDFSTLEKKSMICDFKFNFVFKDHYKRRDAIFDKVKKLKKADKILSLRLSDTNSNLTEVQKLEDNLPNNLKPIKPIWYNKLVLKDKKVKESNSEKKYKILSFDNYDIGVGLSATGNDQLRKEWAKKNDVWFHLEGDKSPHLIIKLKDDILSEDKITMVASVMSQYSDGDRTEVLLIYSQVKNIKGMKGAAGKVTYKKEKHIKAFTNKNWKDSLL